MCVCVCVLGVGFKECVCVVGFKECDVRPGGVCVCVCVGFKECDTWRGVCVCVWVCEFHVLQWEIGMRTIMFYIKNIIFYFKLQKVKTCNCLVTLLNKIVHTAVTRTANSDNKLTINIS